MVQPAVGTTAGVLVDFLTVSGPPAPRHHRIYEIIKNVSVVCYRLNHFSCSQACWVTYFNVFTSSHPDLKTQG